jgi:hypothetical protein
MHPLVDLGKTQSGRLSRRYGRRSERGRRRRHGSLGTRGWNARTSATSPARDIGARDRAGRGVAPDCPGAGITPICSMMRGWSQFRQSSTSLPPGMRKTSIPVPVVGLPAGEYPCHVRRKASTDGLY